MAFKFDTRNFQDFGANKLCNFVFDFQVRREKISERMKLLQNLAPNCNKVSN